jgi:hypothetical protein
MTETDELRPWEKEHFLLSILRSEKKLRPNADSTTANTKYWGAAAPAE